MKHSIKWQVTGVFAGLLLVMILVLMAINLRFLEPYYINNKKDSFIEMYQELDEALKAGTIGEDEVSTGLAHLAEENNISFLISDQGSEKVYTNVHNPELLRNQMVGYLLNQAQKQGKVLETTDDYEISQSYDPWNENDYLDMWGQMGTGHIEMIDEAFIPGEGDGVGKPGTHVFTFVGTNPGHVTLTFSSRQPWQGGRTGDTEVFSVTVYDDMTISYL